MNKRHLVNILKTSFWANLIIVLVDAAMLFNPRFTEFRPIFLSAATCCAVGALCCYTVLTNWDTK